MGESDFKKAGLVQKLAAGKADMARVNAQALVELTAEDVFVFRIAACDDQPDRDNEQFTLECLQGLAKLYVGKTVIMDHKWSAANQTARVYDTAVELSEGVNRLILYAYMLRSEATADMIASIEGGILREVSVGCAVEDAVCNICGANKRKSWCEHMPGRVYDGTKCVVRLSGPRDAYEVSFCAVPAQPGAGVVKRYGGEDNKPEPPAPGEDTAAKKELALLELERQRY